MGPPIRLPFRPSVRQTFVVSAISREITKGIDLTLGGHIHYGTLKT